VLQEEPGARIQGSVGRQFRIAGQNNFLGFMRCVPDTESSVSWILAPGPCGKAFANDFILLEFRSGEQVSIPFRFAAIWAGRRRSFRNGAKDRR
jgi:hypothetical protein